MTSVQGQLIGRGTRPPLASIFYFNTAAASSAPVYCACTCCSPVVLYAISALVPAATVKYQTFKTDLQEGIGEVAGVLMKVCGCQHHIAAAFAFLGRHRIAYGSAQNSSRRLSVLLQAAWVSFMCTWYNRRVPSVHWDSWIHVAWLGMEVSYLRTVEEPQLIACAVFCTGTNGQGAYNMWEILLVT